MSDKYIGTPERYLSVPEKQELDADALSCTLIRAKSVCLLVSSNLGDGSSLNDEILAGALWAVEGLIGQAQILTHGKGKSID